MRLPEAHLSKAAMEKELKGLQDLNVYRLVPKSDVPEGQNVIGSKWVFKLKADSKFKAKIFAQGWNQGHGKDCYGTYAPVCRLQSIRMVLAIAAETNGEVIQVDVIGRYLAAPRTFPSPTRVVNSLWIQTNFATRPARRLQQF